MLYKQLLKIPSKKILVGLIGTGHFGTAIISQSQNNDYIKVPIIADKDLNRAKSAFNRAGIPDEKIKVCYSRKAAIKSFEAGNYIIIDDPIIMMDFPINVVAEATGNPEAAASHALAAIKNGKNVAMISKEADSAIGPILNYKAEKNNLIYTAVEGDQHGLLMNLVDWAKLLGLEIISAGKARDDEFVYERSKNLVICKRENETLNNSPRSKISQENSWAFENIPKGKAQKYVSFRKKVLSKLPQTRGFDLCEMVIAANNTGLIPDVPKLRKPILKISEIPEALCIREEGGILKNKGAIDVVTCIRNKNEAGMGGGVYLVVSCKNNYSQKILTTKGPLTNSRKTAALIYRPYHICGVETLTSLIYAGLLEPKIGNKDYRPLYDMIQVSKNDKKSGEILGDDHDLSLEASIIPAKSVSSGNPLPAHLLNGRRLKKDIKAGEIITYDMVEEPVQSTLWNLRKEQDLIFNLK